ERRREDQGASEPADDEGGSDRQVQSPPLQKQSEPGERGACRSVLAHHLREEETDIGKPVGPGGSLAHIDVPEASTRNEEEKIVQTPNRAVEVDLRIH